MADDCKITLRVPRELAAACVEIVQRRAGYPVTEAYAVGFVLNFGAGILCDGGVEAAMRAPVDGVIRAVGEEFGADGLERVLARMHAEHRPPGRTH